MSLEEERKDLVDRLEETQSKKSTLQLDLGDYREPLRIDSIRYIDILILGEVSF